MEISGNHKTTVPGSDLGVADEQWQSTAGKAGNALHG